MGGSGVSWNPRLWLSCGRMVQMGKYFDSCTAVSFWDVYLVSVCVVICVYTMCLCVCVHTRVHTLHVHVCGVWCDDVYVCPCTVKLQSCSVADMHCFVCRSSAAPVPPLVQL